MIRNVIDIHRFESSGLSGVTRAQVFAEELSDKVGWERLDIRTPAKLSIINKVVDKNNIWEAQLVFRTCDYLDVTAHWIYRASLANGQVVVIGGMDRPYPVTTVSDSIPDNLTDSQLREVTVTYSSRAKIPLIG